MTDAETLDRARLLFTGETQGDKLAREVIGIAERASKRAALWEEIADQREKALATLRAQRNEFMEMLTPLKDAVLFARSQRRPMGIGQDHGRAADCVQIQLGAEYGRERDCVGFWIDSPQITHTDADSPDPCDRIALALIRLAYSVAEKVKPPRAEHRPLVSRTGSKP